MDSLEKYKCIPYNNKLRNILGITETNILTCYRLFERVTRTSSRCAVTLVLTDTGMCAVWQENASASSTKIDNCFQSLVSGLQQGGRSKLYPHSVSTPIDEASIPIWFDAWLLGWNEGRVLPSCGIFQTSWVTPAPYACQPKN